jgi:hypothetical protein
MPAVYPSIATAPTLHNPPSECEKQEREDHKKRDVVIGSSN